MDIMMPQMDGLTATARLRQESNVPVIFLTAKSEDADLLLGLNIGGDDYITKPFKPVEVLARVRSHLRRYVDLGGLEKRESQITIGGVSLDDDSKTVTLDGEPVSLTPLEYNILKFLMENAGKVFKSEEIYRAVWNGPTYGAEGTVPVHIRHLREKLELDPGKPRYLKVVWGQGYKFEKGATV
jgi:DNA-binding response OmpR family regulator